MEGQILKDRFEQSINANSTPPNAVKPCRALSTPSARTKWLSTLAGLAGPILIPLLHISLYSVMWPKFNRKVDRINCRCSCWDNVFKGNYEAGIGTFKHVYFNATANTFWMWAITVMGAVALYESFRHVCRLAVKRRVRLLMLGLFGGSIYPIYYAWWMYFNYINDGFYHQWFHQLYFTVTEVAASCAVFQLIDSRRPCSIRSLLVVLSVGVAHVLISAYDQAVANVMRGDGDIGQVLRDLAFLVPDLSACLVTVVELKRLGWARGRPAAHLVANREFLACVAFVIGSWLLCLLL